MSHKWSFSRLVMAIVLIVAMAVMAVPVFAAPAGTTDAPDGVTMRATGVITGYFAGTVTSLDTYDRVKVCFEYGPTTSYGYTTTSRVVTAVPYVFTRRCPNLFVPGYEYHYRLVIKYGADYALTVNGADQSFSYGDLGAGSGTNPQFVLDYTDVADHTAAGLLNKHTAGAELAMGNVVYIGADSKLEIADADQVTTTPGLFLVLGSITENATGNVLSYGYFRDDTYTWTPGGVLYLSATDGAMTQTAPVGVGDYVQRLGVAVSADVIFFNPDLYAYVVTP
jgi:hypothetical protein